MKNPFSLLFCLITFSFVFVVGFADALIWDPIYSYRPSSYYDYVDDPCEECGGYDYDTHYDVTYYPVKCPDCGKVWTDYSGGPNTSSSCNVTQSSSQSVYRCSSCELKKDIMEWLFEEEDQEEEPEPPPSSPYPPGWEDPEEWGYEHVWVPRLGEGSVTLPQLLLGLSNIFTSGENPSDDVWLNGWDLWYYETPTPRTELPEDLKFRIETQVGVNV